MTQVFCLIDYRWKVFGNETNITVVKLGLSSSGRGLPSMQEAVLITFLIALTKAT